VARLEAQEVSDPEVGLLREGEGAGAVTHDQDLDDDLDLVLVDASDLVAGVAEAGARWIH